MRATLIGSIAGIATALVATIAVADETYTMDQVHALDARCEAARVTRLTPIRQRKVAACKAAHERDDCEIFYSTYGDNSSRVSGGSIRGMFYNLPECVSARRALRHVRKLDSTGSNDTLAPWVARIDG